MMPLLVFLTRTSSAVSSKMICSITIETSHCTPASASTSVIVTATVVKSAAVETKTATIVETSAIVESTAIIIQTAAIIETTAIVETTTVNDHHDLGNYFLRLWLQVCLQIDQTWYHCFECDHSSVKKYC